MNETAPEQIAFYNQQQNGKNRVFGKTTPKLIGTAAVFGIFFAYLFTRQTAGLNMLLFAAAIYAFALVNKDMLSLKTFRQAPEAYLMAIPVILLAASLFLARSAIDGLGLFVILFILLAQYLVLTHNARHLWYSPLFLIDMFFGGLNRVLLGMGYFFSGTGDTLFKQRSIRKKGVIVGIVIGIVLLIITIPFLLMADDNIAVTFEQIFSDVDFSTIILFLFMFFFGAALVTGPVATAKYGEFAGRAAPHQRDKKRPLQPATVVIALSMIGIVYVLFASVQFQYFFVPRETLSSVLGLTSAAYAVKGFGELIYITCLNVVLIAASMCFTQQKDGKTQPYLKALYTLLVVFNFVIMASSHLRMQCYEISFGYTVARFLSHGFMILLIVLNVLMLVQIYCSRFNAAKWFVLAAVVYYCAITVINPDLFVARRNIDRYKNGSDIDAAYMFTLSASALPEVCDFAAGHPEVFDEAAQRCAENRLARSEAQEDRGWQSLNIADIAARHALQQLLE